jgi:hypothetical protein
MELFLAGQDMQHNFFGARVINLGSWKLITVQRGMCLGTCMFGTRHPLKIYHVDWYNVVV